MGRLTQQETVQYLRDAGFPEHVIPTMTAVTGAESGYKIRAFNPRGADQSYGPLQINMLGELGPDRRKRYGLKSNEDLYDPATNFRIAKRIYDEEGLKAWGAYTNNKYKDFLPSSQAAYSAASLPKPKKDPAIRSEPEPSPTKPSPTKPSATKFSLKESLLQDLMGSIIQDYVAPTVQPQKESDTDIYMAAANELSASEDPYDQELARKYESKALSQPSPVYDAPATPAETFARLFSS